MRSKCPEAGDANKTRLTYFARKYTPTQRRVALGNTDKLQDLYFIYFYIFQCARL